MSATTEFDQYASQTTPLTRGKLSLTTPAPTDMRGQVSTPRNTSEETFFKSIDGEMEKVEKFTNQIVDDLKQRLSRLESDIAELKMLKQLNEKNRHEFKSQADDIGVELLRLEKYVNVNFMGFHKILKKHDKYLPGNPCKAFYVARMHRQNWVTADYSVIVVKLSSIYSDIRGDDFSAEEATKDIDDSQTFLRSTKKYWVETEDVSAVKYAVLQHLPVFLQNTSTGQSDSQLTNSVYLDNDSLGKGCFRHNFCSI